MKTAIIIITIFVLAIGVYANSFNNSFIWDDYSFVAENKAIRSLNNIPSLFTEAGTVAKEALSEDVYRPLMPFSFAIDYHLWKLNPGPYHVVNTLFHAFNAILFFFIARCILKKALPAIFAAAIFAVHPIQTEAVTWISGRADVLFLFFYFLGWLAHIGYRQRPDRPKKLYIAALLCFILAVLSKEMAITLPLVLILYDIFFVSGPEKRKIKAAVMYYTPFFIIITGMLLLRFHMLGHIQQCGWWGGSPYSNFITMIKIFAGYLKLIVFPVRLSAEYVIPISHTLLDPKVIFSSILLLSVLFSGIILFKRSRTISFGIVLFCLTLLPVSNIVPLRTLIAERFLYLPSVGFCLIIASSFAEIHKRLISKGTIFASAAVIACISLLLMAYSIRTVNRNRDWKDSLSFWSATVESAPASARAHYNLGNALDNTGKRNEAIREYKMAIGLDETYGEPHNNLGTVYVEIGRLDDAEKEYRIAVALEPDSSKSHYNLGLLYNKKGMFKSALYEYQKAVELDKDKDNPGLYYNRGVVLTRLKRYSEAKEEFLKALNVDPGYAKARFNLGCLLYNEGAYQDAARELRATLKTDPLYEKARTVLKSLEKKGVLK